MIVYRTDTEATIDFDLDYQNQYDLKTWIGTHYKNGEDVIKKITLQEKKLIVVRILEDKPIMLKDIE